MLKLSKQNAANVLGLRKPIVVSELKTLCREALERYCPTEGAVRTVMTPLLVEAYRLLAQSTANVEPAQDPSYGERLSTALDFVTEQQLSFELCGVWLWVFDRTGRFQETFQAQGFQWASKKGCWFLQPTVVSKPKNEAATYESWDFNRIRATYGSEAIV